MSITTRAHTEPEETFPNPSYAITSHQDATPPTAYEVVGTTGQMDEAQSLSITTSPPRPQTEPEETFPNPSYAITSHPDATPPGLYEAIGITGQMDEAQSLSITTSPPRPQTEPEETFTNPSYAVTSHPDATPPALYEAIGTTGQMDAAQSLSITTSPPRAQTEPEETFPNPSYAITSHPDATPPALHEAAGITGESQGENGQEPDYI